MSKKLTLTVLSAALLLAGCGSTTTQAEADVAAVKSSSLEATAGSIGLEGITLSDEMGNLKTIPMNEINLPKNTAAKKSLEMISGIDKGFKLLEEGRLKEGSLLLQQYGINVEQQDNNLSSLGINEIMTLCEKYFPLSDANKSYTLGSNEVYIDGLGRPGASSIMLKPNLSGTRQETCQTKIGNLWLPNPYPKFYAGGHLVAAELGGWGGRANIVPMFADLNGPIPGNDGRPTPWRYAEKAVGGCRILSNTSKPKYRVIAIYNDDSVIPEQFTMEVIYTGLPKVNGIEQRTFYKVPNLSRGGTFGQSAAQIFAASLTKYGCSPIQ